MRTKHVIMLLIISVIVIFYIQAKDLKEHNQVIKQYNQVY
jgi:hypothetical protein